MTTQSVRRFAGLRAAARLPGTFAARRTAARAAAWAAMIAVAVAATLVTVAATPAPLLAQGLTPEQVVSLEVVRQPALSPDGRWIAYTLTRPRDEAEERGLAWSELYVVPAAGGETRAIVQRPQGASDPRWSPDGSTLGFAARLPAHDQRQVYGVPAAGGEPRVLTTSATAVVAFAWSPSGDRIAYTAPVAEPPDAAERRARGDDVVVMSEAGRHVALWIQPVGSPANARRVTPEDRTVRDFAWAPDGSRLALQVTEGTTADDDLMFRELVTVPAAGGELRRLAETEGKLGPMAWSPGGATLAYLGATAFNDPIAGSVFVVPAAGGTPRNLMPGFEGTAVSVSWLDDATVAFVADQGTRTMLNRVPAAGGAIQRLAGGGAEIFGDVSWDRNRNIFATAAHTSRHPAELFTGNRRGELRRLTDHNDWLATVPLGRQETIEWTGPEGLRIEGVLIHPVDMEGARAPLAILPHGGPEGISLDGWVTNPLYPAQVLAGRGYAVLLPNYRASGGRGVEFSKADHRDLGGREFDDVIAGIDHLADRGIIDPDRVGMSGTSYGGYFSAWAGTRHSHRFRVTIPFAGIANWTSFTGTTDIPVEMSAVHWDLWWMDNPGLYWDRSPLAHADSSSTPMLIGHGLVDERVHPGQSLELYHALRLQGVPVELILYPREPHGLRERTHQLDYMRRIMEWLDRYLKEPADVSVLTR